MLFLDENEAVPSAHWIDDGVACGSFASAGCVGGRSRRETRRKALEAAGVTHVVNCAKELPCAHPASFTYLHVPAADVDGQDLLGLWAETSDFVDDALAAGGRVLVHCAGGHSRSGATVVAWLMRRRDLRDADAALELARARRRVVKPIPGFVDQLHAWADSGFDAPRRAGCVRIPRR